MEIRTIASALQFPEGPIAMPDGSLVLVEIARGTLSRVQPNGTVSVIAELGGGPNGAAIGPDGHCYVCNNGGFSWHERNGRLFPGDAPADYRGGSIQRVNLTTGAVEILYTHCNGQPLRGPNDIVFDAQGGFWFTDLGKTQGRSRDRTGVFYAHTDGSMIKEVLFPLDGPNGIGLAPDESTLYVAETITGKLWAYALRGPGEIDPRPGTGSDRNDGGRLLPSVAGHHMYDSLAVDSRGFVCVATIGRQGGISVIDPSGKQAPVLVQMRDSLTTNICFGGPDLRTAYISLSSFGELVAMTWPAPGLALNFLNK